MIDYSIIDGFNLDNAPHVRKPIKTHKRTTNQTVLHQQVVGVSEKGVPSQKLSVSPDMRQPTHINWAKAPSNIDKALSVFYKGKWT